MPQSDITRVHMAHHPIKSTKSRNNLIAKCIRNQFTNPFKSKIVIPFVQLVCIRLLQFFTLHNIHTTCWPDSFHHIESYLYSNSLRCKLSAREKKLSYFQRNSSKYLHLRIGYSLTVTYNIPFRIDNTIFGVKIEFYFRT